MPTPEQVTALVGGTSAAPVVTLLTNVVAGTFFTHPSTRTDAVVRERFELAWQTLRILVGDFKWSLPRVTDHLLGYVRLQLDGLPWQPSERRVWLSGG